MTERRTNRRRGRGMPTYDYICDACSHEFEAYESIKADSQTVCPVCHESKLRRKIGRGRRSCSRGRGSTRPTTGASPTRRGPPPTSRPSRSLRTRARRVIRGRPRRRRLRRLRPPRPRRTGRVHDPGALPDLREGLRDSGHHGPEDVPLLLAPLPARRPRPLDRRRVCRPRPGGSRVFAGRRRG